jgi:hypothetical protein
VIAASRRVRTSRIIRRKVWAGLCRVSTSIPVWEHRSAHNASSSIPVHRRCPSGWSRAREWKWLTSADACSAWRPQGLAWTFGRSVKVGGECPRQAASALAFFLWALILLEAVAPSATSVMLAATRRTRSRAAWRIFPSSSFLQWRMMCACVSTAEAPHVGQRRSGEVFPAQCARLPACACLSHQIRGRIGWA